MWDVRKGYYQSLSLEIEATNSNSQSLAPAMFSHLEEETPSSIKRETLQNFSLCHQQTLRNLPQHPGSSIRFAAKSYFFIIPSQPNWLW
jgi:hypothetical protein